MNNNDELNGVPTFRTLFLHEAYVLTELTVINVAACVFTWLLGMPYELVIPALVIFLLRAKRYDYNTLDEPLPLAVHLARICLVIAIFSANMFIFGMVRADVKPQVVPRRLTGLGFQDMLMEQLFCNTLFAITVLTMRFFCQIAILCGSSVDTFRQPYIAESRVIVTARIGPGGDGPHMRHHLPISQSFPMLVRRLQENAEY